MIVVKWNWCGLNYVYIEWSELTTSILKREPIKAITRPATIKKKKRLLSNWVHLIAEEVVEAKKEWIRCCNYFHQILTGYTYKTFLNWK